MNFYLTIRYPCSISPSPNRERREYLVYRSLLNMVPGLEERLVNSSDEETRIVADLVRWIFSCVALWIWPTLPDSCKRELPVLDQMTLKAWKVQFWTGLFLVENPLTPPLPAMSNVTTVSIMRRLDFYSVLSSLIGPIKSIPFLYIMVVPDIPLSEWRQNCVVVITWCRVTNGLTFYTRIIFTTPRILGVAFCEAPFSSW